MRGFASLDEAIEWTAQRWQERPVPIRLHDWDTDGIVGLRYSAAFLRALSAGCDDKETVEMTEPCYHPLVRIGQDLRECPGCDGMGTKKAWRERWRWPMWRAFSRLVKAHNKTPRHPHPSRLVMTLSNCAWDGRAAAVEIERDWEVAEALFLTSLRQLQGHYEEAPVGRVGWVSKSQSQREAEEAVA